MLRAGPFNLGTAHFFQASATFQTFPNLQPYYQSRVSTLEEPKSDLRREGLHALRESGPEHCWFQASPSSQELFAGETLHASGDKLIEIEKSSGSIGADALIREDTPILQHVSSATGLLAPRRCLRSVVCCKARARRTETGFDV